MSLERVLERTGLRASLSTDYASGAAPNTQHDGSPAPGRNGSYFGLPAIRAPGWDWYVPAYFFAGGTACGAYVLATIADVIGKPRDRGLVLAGRLVALLGLLLSPPLLIVDLGRPERFLNMLRVFKPRSMMNTGSWGLTTFGLFGGLSVVVELLLWQSARWRLAGLGAAALRPVTWLGLLPALYVGAYTGLLLSATNVPLWARNYRFLSPLFLSSAMSSGLAATLLATRLLRVHQPESRNRVARAERVVLLTELGLTLASLAQLRGAARPLLRAPFVGGSIGMGMLAPLLIDDRLEVLRSVLVLFGSACTRFAWTSAGKRSADDPHAYFAYTGTPGAEAAQSQARRKRHGEVPRAQLPEKGRLQGVITLAQEDRFRIEDRLGRGYLLTLGRGLGVGVHHLRDWSARQVQLEVEYEGQPDLGAVATHVRELETR